MEQVQIDMEKLFHKNQLYSRIRSEFEESEIPFEEAMIEAGLNPEFGFDLLVQMVLHKRAGIPVLVGILRKHFNGDCQSCADALLVATKIDLIDWHPQSRKFVVKFNITPDVQQEIDTYQYPLPMIVQPKELKTNRDTGYYTANKNSLILKHNHHDEDICLDHLNHVNKIKLSIYNDVSSMIRNQWRNLDKPKPNEDQKEFDKRRKAFDKYDRTAYDVMSHLQIANNKFYLTHKYDKRGRVYCQGYHVNYQGNAWNKAVIKFASEEIVEG